jgi:hypothetical protein
VLPGLEQDGVLIFKWNETQIKTAEVLSLTDQKPLFGHISGKRANTHWICFMKERQEATQQLGAEIQEMLRVSSDDVLYRLRAEEREHA